MLTEFPRLLFLCISLLFPLLRFATRTTHIPLRLTPRLDEKTPPRPHAPSPSTSSFFHLLFHSSLVVSNTSTSAATAPVPLPSEVASTQATTEIAQVPVPGPSSLPSNSFAPPAAAADPRELQDAATSTSKASLNPSQASTTLLTDSLPPSHPVAGVAPLGAASLVASNARSTGSALTSSDSVEPSTAATTTTTENMARTQQQASAPSTPSSKKQAAAVTKGKQQEAAQKEKELVQFVERDGHFSLVR